MDGAPLPLDHPAPLSLIENPSCRSGVGRNEFDPIDDLLDRQLVVFELCEQIEGEFDRFVRFEFGRITGSCVGRIVRRAVGRVVGHI